MNKKINIFLVLLLLAVSISAVSAADNGTGLISDDSIRDTVKVSADEDINYNSEDVLTVDESDCLLSNSTHTITNENYNQYFDSKGNLVSSSVQSGDTINLDGSFSSKKFIFSKQINIVGTSNNKMTNSMITLLSGASGSTILNLNIVNTNAETYGIFLNSACNCVVKGCVINNTGAASYPICVGNNANYNNVTDNELTSYGITYGHGTRSTPGLVVSGSHYNYIANNYVQIDDANGIYLSSYEGGPLKGGISNFNVIFNNTVRCNVLPTSWSYNIQIMGNNNTVKANKVIHGYRGISTSGSGSIIVDNFIINLTGADYNHVGVETGGEYGIVGAYNAIIRNNTIINSKIISTGAGISGIDNCTIENNWVNVTKVGRGIVAAGSNVIIRNNNIFTVSGSGINEKDEGSGLLIENNNITSVSAVGILIEKLSAVRMPSNVTVIGNIVKTGNKVAIDASGAQVNTSFIDEVSNIVYGKLIKTPSGVIDTSKPTYIYRGTTINITNENYDEYINANGGLQNIKSGDILVFDGTFTNKVIYINEGIKITGKNPVFYNSTFKVTAGNVLIENLTIINIDAERVNAWGIFTNQAYGVRIVNNNITVKDPKAAYAVYALESVYVDVWNNVLTSQGDYLTFTLLSYASEECNFANNTIKTIGTGEVYSFVPESCIDGNELVIDGKSYCIDGNELVIDGTSYCIDGDEIVIDGKSYCIDGNELVIDGTSYCIDGNEVVIDGKSYCIDGNEIVIDGTSYCIDGEELVIDGVHYTLTNKTITINGTTYCIDGDEVVIDGKSYCIDGNEIVIDGTSYCIDGEELVIDGVSYALNNGNVTINGTTYCIDGNEIVIDGKYYCIDGNELVINGTSYGSDYSTSNAHVVSEIYQTYGILLLYSSNCTVYGNNVNVTSSLAEVHNTTGSNGSTNSLVGIDVYFNCHNNVISKNNVYIKGNDNYLYGLGVLGYKTGHKAPEGQGASNNTFEGNTIILEGPYFATGLIVGSESEETILKDNVINLKTDGVTYGITFELSENTVAEGNDITLNSQVIYGIEAYSSNSNCITNNKFKLNSKEVYGMLLSNSEYNTISGNIISANGTGENLTIRNLDSLKCGYAGLYLKSNSSNNVINKNNITSIKGYAILMDDEAINNIITDNYLYSEKGASNNAVNNTDGNTVEYNYHNIANANIKVSEIKYLGNGQFNVSFDSFTDDALVKFYDADGELIGEANVLNGIAVFNYTFDESYTPAYYKFTVKLFKDEYKTSTWDIPLSIDNADPKIDIEPISMIQGDTDTISLKIVDPLGNPIKGATVSLLRNGRNMLGEDLTSDANGVAEVQYTLPVALDVGNYTIQVKVTGMDYFNDANVYTTLSVLPRLDVSISINSNIYIKGVVVTLKDSNGDIIANKKISLKVGTVTYSVTTNANGQVLLPAAVKAGSYSVTVTSQALGKYDANSLTKKVLVVNPITGGKDYSVYYGNTVKYKVRIFATNGKAVGAGKTVTFKINGKTKNVKTDKNGYATYSAKLSVGKYTITATYGSYSVSNKITFKSTIISKNIVKKKAKKIIFSAKLVNKKGKVLKNKKITFKFKGKTYKVKTNKKGIAKITLKKLKVGKYKIISKYGGCQVTNTITVKK